MERRPPSASEIVTPLLGENQTQQITRHLYGVQATTLPTSDSRSA